MVASLALSLLVAFAIVTLGFGVAHFRNRRYDFIDSVWGILFIGIAWTNVLIGPTKNALAIMAAFLVTIWGVRLSRHIFVRWLKSAHEDKRYVELRERWPKRAIGLQVFVRIYILQAILATIISVPVILFINAKPVFDEYVLVGVMIWAFGIGIESLADRQLREFLRVAQNKGQIMTRGLWSYSRHPNYFGEILIWWGIGIMGLGQAYGPLGLIGPIVISALLVFVSGVPLAEKAMASKPGWKEYASRTPVLIPWPKR